jgi:death on curing protein
VTVYLTFEQVLAIHDAAAGPSGIRDAGAIQSAVGRPQATVFGEDAYGSIWEKAAALLQSLARNHGWMDGNKRTAWVAALTFLTVNGHPLDPAFDQDAAEAFMVAVAEGSYADVADIASELVKFTR